MKMHQMKENNIQHKRVSGPEISKTSANDQIINRISSEQKLIGRKRLKEYVDPNESSSTTDANNNPEK